MVLFFSFNLYKSRKELCGVGIKIYIEKSLEYVCYRWPDARRADPEESAVFTPSSDNPLRRRVIDVYIGTLGYVNIEPRGCREAVVYWLELVVTINHILYIHLYSPT